MEIVLLGHMGRDEALADRLGEHELHVLGEWENPGLVEKAKASGGRFHIIDSIVDVDHIADFVEDTEPDMFLTNFDDALAAGVVDAVEQQTSNQNSELLLPCPDRESSRIEWDKFYLREIVDEIDPRYNPDNFMAETPDMVRDAVNYFSEANKQVAIKPRNLTGGKGVKVMGKHLGDLNEAEEYALHVIASDDQEGVEIQEKLEGHEFTLQLLTDGTALIEPPVTYDYPYREDGDTGPGTGGMGSFTMEDGKHLPFVTEQDYEEASTLMNDVLSKLKERGHDYKGVLYPTFFKTSEGLKIVEINARGGDPELINIMDLMEDDVDLGEVLGSIARGELDEDSVRYKNLASAMIYLVSPDYGYRKGPAHEFGLDPDIISGHDCKIRFAAAEKTGGNSYRSVGSSRTVGLSALGNTPWEARHKIHSAIEDGLTKPLPLEYRREIADQDYISNLV